MKRYLDKYYKKFICFFNFKNEYAKMLYYQSFYYQSLKHKKNTLDTYLKLYQECTNSNFITTDLKISFSDDLTFGSSIRQAKKINGTPNFKSEDKDINLEVLYYRLLIGSHKVKCQLFFYKNELFMYCYTFTHIKNMNNNEVLDTIKAKYLNENQNYSKEIIKDNYNNCIHFEDDISLTISYTSLSSMFYNKILEKNVEIQEVKNEERNENLKTLFQRI